MASGSGEEVGVAFVRLVPSMRGFGPEAQRALNDNTRGPAGSAGQAAGGRFAGAFKGAVAGGAALAVTGLVAAVGEALDQGKIVAKLRAQLGATPAEAKKYGQIAGDLYAGAIVEDFQQGADTIRAVMSSGLVPPDATNSQIKSIATNVADLANTFDLDLSAAANAAGSMMKNGMAKDGGEALDLLTKGMTGLGPASEDLLETVTEYGPVFKSAGISGQTAMGLIKQAVQGGWVKDTDKIGDAFKELNLRATEGSKGVTGAFKALGLNAKQTGDDIAAGGARGEKAMGLVLDKLRELGPNTQEAKQIVSTLFGGPGEDLGAALFALDVGKASKAMGDAAGAADELGNSMRDNAAAKIEIFKRTVTQSVVGFLGNTVIPAITDFTSFVGDAFGGMWKDAGKGGKEGADRFIAFFRILGERLVAKAKELAPKAFTALQNFGRTVAEWVMANPEKIFKIAAIAAAVIFVVTKLPLLVAAAFTAAAATMMASFVGRLLSALKENLPKWWKSFTGFISQKAGQAASFMASLGTAIGRWFSGLWSTYVAGPVSRQWNSFMATIRALPARTVIALAQLGTRLAAVASAAWQRFKDSAAAKAVTLVSWVRGIPGRVKSALGNIGSLLWNAGASLIQGFINGIKSKLGSVRNAASSIVSTARNYFPFSPAKEGPFSGRGYTLYSGRALIQGFQAGISDQLPALRAQLGRLPGATLPLATAPAGAGAAATTPAIVIDAHGMPRALVEWLRNSIRVDAGGSAERYFKPV
ncbi:phage tail tape measure protein [Streptomyces antibioticus]|uniref:phage tail tape measure protein n=1 Tax=Streptomyces antibioticus TaxID=1890 RepID=UPI003D702B74